MTGRVGSIADFSETGKVEACRSIGLKRIPEILAEFSRLDGCPPLSDIKGTPETVSIRVVPRITPSLSSI